MSTMPWVDPVWIEFQISSLKVVLFLLAWYSQEIGYSIIWYFLSILELLVFTLQFIFYSGYSDHHVDSWGSPFGLPALLVTHIAAILTYVFFYHLWWHKHTWKPSFSTLLYVLVLAGIGIYWTLLVPIWWYQTLISTLIGIGYAVLTSFIIKWFLIPVIIDYFIDTFGTTILARMMGSQNTLLVERK